MPRAVAQRGARFARKIEEAQFAYSLPSPSSSRDLLRRRALPAGSDRDVRDILRLNDGRHGWIKSWNLRKETNACLHSEKKSEE